MAIRLRMDQYVETTREGFTGKMGKSIKGALMGVVLILVGVIGLFWNEGRAVKRYQDLVEGFKLVVAGDSGAVDSNLNEKLVYMTGVTAISDPLSDPDFGVSATAVKLSRRVQMFQWVEKTSSKKKEKLGGGTETETTYSYDKTWSNSYHDSSGFRISEGHQNPPMRFSSTDYVASKVSLGAYELSPKIAAMLSGSEAYPVTSIEQATEQVKADTQVTEKGLYLGKDPSSPEIGDLLIQFFITPTGPVSVVAKQSNNQLSHYTTRRGRSLALVESGSVEVSDMFQNAHSSNKFLTWIIRFAGFLAVSIGFSSLLGPIAAFSSIIPMLGRFARAGIGFVGFLLGAIVSLVTISLAWIFYRPLLGIAILLVAVVLITLLLKRTMQSHSIAASAATDGGPPPLN